LLSGETNLVPRRTPTGARSSSPGELALPTTSPSPWSDSARTRSRGDTGQAEELCRRALAMTEVASTSCLAAHARVQLARVLEAAGDADTTETLYRSVIEWSQTPRPRQVRESLFVGLAGSPGAAALRGLARLAAARGDGEAADDLHARAAAMAERDRASPDALRGAAAAT